MVFIQIMLIIVALILILWGGMIFCGKRFKELLKAYPTFSARLIETDPPVEYQYADVQDVNLKKLRDTYNLLAIASNGSETEKLINVMNWVHQLTRHAINPTIPKELNALALIKLCKTEKKKLNCWMYSIVLTEAYLSLGYPARIIHLKPYWGETKESHFVTAVYSSDLGKWINDGCRYVWLPQR